MSDAAALRKLSDTRLAEGEVGEALNRAMQAATLATEVGDQAAEASALAAVFNARAARNEGDQALRAAGRARKLYQKLGDKAGEAAMLSAIAKAHAMRGATEEAKEAADAAAKLGDKNGAKEALETSGRVGEDAMAVLARAEKRLALGEAEGVLDSLKTVLLQSREVGDKESERKALQMIADSFLTIGQTAEALRAATKAVALADDQAAKGAALLVVAKSQLAKGDGEAALKACREAGTNLKGNKAGEAAATIAQAEAHSLMKGGAAEAVKAAKSAIDSAKAVGDAKLQASAELAHAKALFARGDTEDSLSKAREALTLAREANDQVGVGRARELIAKARPLPAGVRAEPVADPDVVLASAKQSYHLVRGSTAPTTIADHAQVYVDYFCSTGQGNYLQGVICVVTGASRGLGKGISQELARMGATVYVTGRSGQGSPTDGEVGGTVDESAFQAKTLGGMGVACHVDHAQPEQTRALASLLSQHGRVDVLVNNAFSLPAPDLVFFNTPVWMQPARFLSEQAANGGLNHVAETILLMPHLRHGKGLVVNVSHHTAQHNVEEYPVSFVVNKAMLERAQTMLANEMRKIRVFPLMLWPGKVKSERGYNAAKKGGYMLVDHETCRFAGRAVARLARMSSEEIGRYTQVNKCVCPADVYVSDIDGYNHEGGLQTFITSGGAGAPRASYLW